MFWQRIGLGVLYVGSSSKRDAALHEAAVNGSRTVGSSTWANGTQSVACQWTVLALLGPTQFSAKIGPKTRSRPVLDK
jgi:hypothetical protein